VLGRVFRVRVRGGKGRLHKRLWEIAEAVTPPGRADRFNQAIMDLGATVCHVRRPECGRCPVRSCCRGRQVAATEEPAR
jgi:A/G-specific adenine glycosylase